MKTLKRTLFNISTVFTLSATALHAQTKPQKVIVIMMDGFGEDYYRSSDMPNLNKIEKNGIYKIVPSLMPSVTNVNNISIATGTTPAVNGITGNVYFNESTGLEEYIESPDLVMTPTIFEKAKKLGIRSALFSSKKKTIDVMGTHTEIALCPECDGAATAKWTEELGIAPPVYSKEISYWVFNAAIKTIKQNPDIGLVYIHSTDYPMHMWAPEEKDSKDFLHHIDALIGELVKAAPDAAILLTADHGMNHKNKGVDLAQVCKNKNTPIKIAISPEKDKYIKHHKGLGGAAYIYLNEKSDKEAVKKVLLATNGVESVLTREEAAKKYDLMPSRIGDFMVIADKSTVFGDLNGKESEAQDKHYRSHGSPYEAKVPLFIYNAKKAPHAAYFDSNYKIASWLYN
ncbi:alkaline phosphatase family protein [uncultured Chryseobacterium sp.]|uniref:alkaline phosphatase family protein n=1 Tax=uncultured Chryseobacterium sp. TaxID=259322 RepID=UPI0025D8B164|nr:nucleotide pyrophosphatase/phosphodiesterase family protein [uncultured Chryseobacterium sp.]